MRHTKENVKNAVKYCQAVFKTMEQQTGGFSTHPKDMPDERLLGQRPVSDWFLEFAPFMFGVWLPKYHAKLRHVIAYCYELQARQQAAYQRDAAQNEQEYRSLKVLIAQFPQMTREQIHSAVKKHFKWEN